MKDFSRLKKNDVLVLYHGTNKENAINFVVAGFDGTRKFPYRNFPDMLKTGERGRMVKYSGIYLTPDFNEAKRFGYYVFKLKVSVKFLDIPQWMRYDEGWKELYPKSEFPELSASLDNKTEPQALLVDYISANNILGIYDTIDKKWYSRSEFLKLIKEEEKEVKKIYSIKELVLWFNENRISGESNHNYGGIVDALQSYEAEIRRLKDIDDFKNYFIKWKIPSYAITEELVKDIRKVVGIFASSNKNIFRLRNYTKSELRNEIGKITDAVDIPYEIKDCLINQIKNLTDYRKYLKYLSLETRVRNTEAFNNFNMNVMDEFHNKYLKSLNEMIENDPVVPSSIVAYYNNRYRLIGGNRRAVMFCIKALKNGVGSIPVIVLEC